MVVYTSPTTLPIDLHKRCLMLYAIMIFITEVWSGLCKLISKEFWPNSVQLTISKLLDSDTHHAISKINVQFAVNKGCFIR